MKKINKSGLECTTGNNTQHMETSQNVPDRESKIGKNAVLIEMNFRNPSHEFHKKIEIVSELSYLKEEIDEVYAAEIEAISYVEDQYVFGEYYINNALAYAKYYLLSPFPDYSLKCKYFLKLIACFGKLQTYINKNPEANFKAIVDIDINNADYFTANLELIPFNYMNSNDRLKLNILDGDETLVAMTLESKLQFFSYKQIEILELILTIISNGNYINYSHISSHRISGEPLTYKVFTSIFQRLDSFYIIKDTRYGTPDEPLIPIFYDYEIFKYFNLPTHNILPCHLLDDKERYKKTS